MAIEIERKFLLRNEGWRAGVTGSLRLRDGLIAVDGQRKVRVRTYDARATLTVKGARCGIARDEFEYDIPLADAEAMFACHCSGQIVEKTRYHVPVAAHLWEIDVYSGLLAGIVIAEVELSGPEDSFLRPDWLGDEITGNPRYRKINMLNAARAGFAPA